MEKIRKLVLERGGTCLFDENLKSINSQDCNNFSIKLISKAVIKKITLEGYCNTLFKVTSCNAITLVEVHKLFLMCGMRPVWFSDGTFECAITEEKLEKSLNESICANCLKRFKNDKGLATHIKKFHFN
jgi:hypothetical protein